MDTYLHQVASVKYHRSLIIHMIRPRSSRSPLTLLRPSCVHRHMRRGSICITLVLLRILGLVNKGNHLHRLGTMRYQGDQVVHKHQLPMNTSAHSKALRLCEPYRKRLHGLPFASERQSVLVQVGMDNHLRLLAQMQYQGGLIVRSHHHPTNISDLHSLRLLCEHHHKRSSSQRCAGAAQPILVQAGKDSPLYQWVSPSSMTSQASRKHQRPMNRHCL